MSLSLKKTEEMKLKAEEMFLFLFLCTFLINKPRVDMGLLMQSAGWCSPYRFFFVIGVTVQFYLIKNNVGELTSHYPKY